MKNRTKVQLFFHIRKCKSHFCAKIANKFAYIPILLYLCTLKCAQTDEKGVLEHKIRMRKGIKTYIILAIICLMANSAFAGTKVAKSILVVGRNLESVSDEPVATLLEQSGYEVVLCKQSELASLSLLEHDAVLISENADADNADVLNLIRGGQISILNMQGFTYAEGRLGWGEPHNGTMDSQENKRHDIYVERPEHPIFKGFAGLRQGDRISILDDSEKQGIMPIKVDLAGTYCLATAYTQGIEDYDATGEPETSIHEVPAEMRGGAKYICLPIARSSSVYLSDDGKQLIRNIVAYLVSEEQVELELPFLEISGFSVEGLEATINQAENTIEIAMDAEQFTELDSLRAASVEITLADPIYSHVHPEDEVMDLHFCSLVPKTFVVTDYISRRAYAFSIRLWHKEGIEETEAESVQPRKELRNGQIVIIKGNNHYSLTGNRIQ